MFFIKNSITLTILISACLIIKDSVALTDEELKTKFRGYVTKYSDYKNDKTDYNFTDDMSKVKDNLNGDSTLTTELNEIQTSPRRNTNKEIIQKMVKAYMDALPSLSSQRQRSQTPLTEFCNHIPESFYGNDIKKLIKTIMNDVLH